MSASISSILQYLAELHNAGKSYSLLNVHRSMLSSMVEHSGTVPVGQLPAVKQLLKGAYNRNPPKPKYSRTWDVNVVLDYLSALGSNQDLGLPMLSRKLAMLLALSTLFRVSELSSIVFSSVEFSAFGASFNLGRTTKTQHSGTLRVVRLPRLKDNILCPVDCLGWYVTITGPSRNAANRDELFMSLKPPFRSITSSTIGHWIKSVLAESGIDPSFSAHSTRGAAASHALSQGISVDSILKTGDWSSESTFTRFYRRDSLSASLPGAVLTRQSDKH